MDPRTKQLLADFVHTAKEDGYNLDDTITKFPELKGVDMQLLADFVHTAKEDNFDLDVTISKFPEITGEQGEPEKQPGQWVSRQGPMAGSGGEQQQQQQQAPVSRLDQQLNSNPNLKSFYEASEDKQGVEAMLKDDKLGWDEKSKSFKDARVLSDNNAAVDQKNWDDSSDGSLAQLLAMNGFTRDDIAVDKNGQYTIGGKTEITATGAWKMRSMGLEVKKGVNYGGDTQIRVQDLDFSEWEKEEDVKKTLGRARKQENTVNDSVDSSELEIQDLWDRSSGSRLGTTKDDYEDRQDGIYYKQYVRNMPIKSGPSKGKLGSKSGFKYTKVGTKYKDGTIRLTSSVHKEHADAVAAFAEAAVLNKKKKTKESKEKKAAKTSGAKNMPKVTDELLKKDDSNIESWFQAYTGFGFSFKTGMWEGDYVTVVADNGDELKVGVSYNAGKPPRDEVDAWMRSHAVDKGTSLDAHLEDVSVTAEQRSNIQADSVSKFDKLVESTVSVRDASDRNRSNEFQTVGDVVNFTDKRLATDGIQAALENTSGKGKSIVGDTLNAWRKTAKNGGGATDEVKHAFKAAKAVAQGRFLNDYVKNNGDKLTPKEKANFFTSSSILSRTDRGNARKEIESNAMKIRWDDPELRSRAVEMYNAIDEGEIVRKNIAESVEAMTANVFNKADTQKIQLEAGEKQESVLRKEEVEILAEVNSVNKHWKDNVSQLEIVQDQVKSFNFDKKIKDIQDRDLTTQEQVDKANDDIKSVYDEYKSLIDKHSSLRRANGQLRKLAYASNKRIEETSIDIRNLQLYQDYVDDNHAWGTQMWVSLTDATLDLGQGLVGVLEMGVDLGISAAGLLIDNVITVPDNADPSIHAWAEWIQGGDEHGGFERSHGFLDDLNEGIDNYQSERREGIQQVSFGDINSAAGFGEWFGVMMAGQIPNLALMYTTGGASLAIMGAGAAGQKYNDLRESNKAYRDSGGFYGTDHGFASMFLSSSLNGTAEALSEKITLGQVTAFKKTFKEIFQEVGFKAGAKKYVKEMMFSPKALSAFGMDSFSEGGSESVATISQNFIDMSMGEDVGLFDNVAESFVSGVMLSGALKSPKLANHVKNIVASKRYYDIIESNHAEQQLLEEQLRTGDLSAKDKDRVNTRIAEITLETTEQLEMDIMKAAALTDPHKKRLFEIDKERARLQREFNEHEDIKDPNEKEAAQKVTNDKWRRLNAEKNDMLDQYEDKDAKRLYQEDVKAAKDYAAAVEKAGGLKTEVQEGNSDQFETFQAEEMQSEEHKSNLKAYIAELQQEMADPNVEGNEKLNLQKEIDNLNDQLDESANNKFNYGAHVPIFDMVNNPDGTLDADGNVKKVPKLVGHKIFINSQTAVKDGVFTTGAHEFLHSAIYSTIKGDPAIADALAEGLIKAVGSDMTPAAKKRFDYKMNQYSPDKRSEETLTVLSEMLIAGELDLSDSAWTKIKDWIRQVISRKYARDINFDETSDVKKFLKDYSASIKGKYTDLGIVKMSVDGAGGKLVERGKEWSKREKLSDLLNANEGSSGRGVEETFEEINRKANFSKMVKSSKDSNPDLKQTFDRFMQNEDGTKKYESKEDFKNSADFTDAYLEIMEGRSLDGLIQQGMTDMGLPPQALREFTRETKENITMRFIENFNPAINESLFGWLTGVSGGAGRSIIYRAKGDVMKAYNDSGRAQTVSMDAMLGEDSTFADTLVDTTATSADAAVDRNDTAKGKMAIDTMGLKPSTKKVINNSVTGVDLDLQGLTYKGVKKLIKGKGATLAPVLEAVASEFGIPSKKIVENKDLDGKQRKAAQEFIKDNSSALLELLPEGQTRSGEATGIPKMILNKFYDKGTRVKVSEGASAAGKLSQTKRANISNTEFLSAFGVNEDGTLDNNKKHDGAIRAMAEQTAMVVANQAVRQEAINKESNPMRVIALVGDGKSSGMFSVKGEAPKAQVLSAVGKINRDLSPEASDRFFEGLANVVEDQIPTNNRSVDSIEQALRNEFSKDPEILSQVGKLAKRLFSTMTPMLNKASVKNAPTVEKKAERVVKLLLNQNLNADQKVAAFTGDNVGAVKRFQDPKYKGNLDTFRATDKLQVHDQYDPADIPGWLRWVSMLQQSSTTSPGRAQAWSDPDASAYAWEITGQHVRFFTENLLIDKVNGKLQIDKKTGQYISSVDPKLKFKLNKSGGIDNKTVTYDGDKIDVNTRFAANTSSTGLKDLVNPTNKAKRRADEKFAREYLLSRFEFFAKQYKNGEISNIEIGMLLSSELSNMNSALRRAATLKYFAEDAHNLKASELRYEHMLPAVTVALTMMDAVINGNGIPDVHALLSQYTVQIISKEFDQAITDSGNASSLPEGTDFNTKGVNIVRNYNDGTLGDPRTKVIIDADTNTKVELSVMHQEYNELLESNNNTRGEIKTITTANGMLKALAEHSFSKKVKGISALDFDDTLATTKSGVGVRVPNPSGKPKPGHKVIFMAGGAGSGKGNVISKLGLEKAGYKIVNSDISLEWLKKNNSLPEDQSNYTSEQRSELSKLTWEARKIAKGKQGKFSGKGDGVVVDGTGGSTKAMAKQVQEFKDKGYDVSMVFVETSLEVAQKRNAERKERSLKEFILNKNHAQVQGNKESFKQLFGDNFNEVSTDNIGVKDALPKEFKGKIDGFTNSYEKRRLNAEEFASEGAEIKENGGEFDFSEFNEVKEGKTAPLFNKALKLAGKFGTTDMFVVTARSAAAAPAIKEFLDAQGLNIPIENIVGLGKSEASAKAEWIAGKISEGYNDFYFADDAAQNVDAVRETLSAAGVKAKVQQAKGNFSFRTKRDLTWNLEEQIVNQLDTETRRYVKGSKPQKKFKADFSVGKNNFEVVLTNRPLSFREGYIQDDSIFELEFMLKEDLGESYPTGFGKTGIENLEKGVGQKVLSIVTNGVLDFVEANNVNAIGFSSYETSRTRLYNTLTKFWAKKMGWQWDSEVYDIASGSTTAGAFVVSNPKAGKMLEQADGTDGKEADFQFFGPNGVVDSGIESQSPPVRDMLSKHDVKGKTQRTKSNFSRRAPKIMEGIISEGGADLNDGFNIMLEQSRGVGRFKEFSGSKARQRGKNKGRFKFFVPPSADDFAGLMYSFMGKGEVGNKHHEWLKKNLFDPFSKGVRHLNTMKQLVANDMKRLKKASPEVKKLLDKGIAGTDYTHQDAIRVYNWTKAGFDIPGLSETDRKKLIKAVESNPKMQAFAENTFTIADKAMGTVKPGENWLAGTLDSDLGNTLESARKTYLAEWIQNKNHIFTPENLNKIEAVYGSNFREALEDITWRMEHGGTKSKNKDRLLSGWMTWIHGSIGTTMFLNARSAILQMISSVNFVNWGDNNALAAAKVFANQPQYWKDVAMIFNSPFLKQRRAGLQTDVNAVELLNSMKNSKNKMKAATAYLLKLGFTPTQIADSFAISTGGATFYRNRIKTYASKGMNQVESEKKAFEDMMELAEETQQSAREDRISQQQASPLGKFILAFQNTPMQYNRLIKKAAMDLVNGRGDPKANVSRIVYYGGIQNMIFYGLQQALFSALFSDDEEDEISDKKKEKVINGMMDTILRGSGMAGAVVATVKNVIIKTMKESEKMDDGEFFTDPDWGNVVIEALNISPPIGIKARKIYSSLKTWEYNRDVIDHMDKTDIDNPMYDAAFSATEAITNLPLSRLYGKYQNLQEAIAGDHETWKRVAMVLGWSKWNFGIKNQDVMSAKGEIKEIKAVEKEEKKEMKKRAKEVETMAEEKEIEESNLLEQDEERAEGQKDIKCAAVSKSGSRCGKKVKGDGNYCTIHEGAVQRTDGEKKQCSHVKASGKRCKMQTPNKSGLCVYHD